MCEFCRQYPCEALCPNAEPREVVERCDICHGPIREDEEYMENCGDIVCMDCVFEMTATEAFEHFGYVRKTAQPDDMDDDLRGYYDM